MRIFPVCDCFGAHHVSNVSPALFSLCLNQPGLNTKETGYPKMSPPALPVRPPGSTEKLEVSLSALISLHPCVQSSGAFHKIHMYFILKCGRSMFFCLFTNKYSWKDAQRRVVPPRWLMHRDTGCGGSSTLCHFSSWQRESPRRGPNCWRRHGSQLLSTGAGC